LAETRGELISQVVTGQIRFVAGRGGRWDVG